MDNLRIKFDKKILREIFSIIQKQTSLISLSKKLNINYRGLKRWKVGGCTISLYHFNKLKELFPGISKFEIYSEKLPRHWGQSKGSKDYIKKLNVNELKIRMENVRSFKKIKIIRIYNNVSDFEKNNPDYNKININIQDEKLLEFYGILMGDGCLSQFLNNNYLKKSISISGNSKKDLQYFQDYLIPLIKILFNVNTKVKFRKKVNGIDIYFLNKGLFNSLKDIGFPIGVKGQISIPNSIIKLPIEKINNLIRGLLDTDGCISARKHENYKYPHIIITTSSNLLREQLRNLLRQQGFPAYINNLNLVVKGNKNFKKWFELIGSSNPRNINKYKEWLETGKIKPFAGL